jgi:hypothetical protein
MPQYLSLKSIVSIDWNNRSTIESIKAGPYPYLELSCPLIEELVSNRPLQEDQKEETADKCQLTSRNEDIEPWPQYGVVGEI